MAIKLVAFTAAEGARIGGTAAAVRCIAVNTTTDFKIGESFVQLEGVAVDPIQEKGHRPAGSVLDLDDLVSRTGRGGGGRVGSGRLGGVWRSARLWW